MREEHAAEVERVLFHLSDARTRARRAAARIQRDGADAHLVEALERTEQELTRLHRQLSQGTYYAVTDRPLTLPV